jgi:uncharacterized membrane protein
VKFIKSHNTIFLLLFSVFCSSLILTRNIIEENWTFLFLIKNLGLAWIPYLISQFFKMEGLTKIKMSVVFFFWLLFFPNTIYTITDLEYVFYRPSLKVWFDIIMLFSYAVLSLFLGFASLRNFEIRISKKYSKIKTTVTVIFVLHLGSIGVYLGRYKRLNSSDVFTKPKELFLELIEVFSSPFNDSNLYIITIVFTMAMYIVYYRLYHFSKNH